MAAAATVPATNRVGRTPQAGIAAGRVEIISGAEAP